MFRLSLAGLVAASLAAIVPAVSLVAEETASSSISNIVFVGDSITQGGTFNSYTVASYRYALFKYYVDNGVSYNPMGTTNGASKNVDVSSKTPTYRGYTFSNVSEAAASARAYQYASHAASTGSSASSSSYYRVDPGTVYPEANRGPLTMKLGLTDPYTDSTTQYYNGSTLTTYSGDTYASLYGDTLADTVCIMIGINDVYDGRDNSEIISNIVKIIEEFQEYNPNITVHVFELLPTGSGNSSYSRYASFNEALREYFSTNTLSTSTSTVTLSDISTGFYAYDGGMIDGSSGAHPNSYGETIVAANIAKVLGLEGRTVGLERKDASDLTAVAKFSASGDDISATFSSTSTDGGTTTTTTQTMSTDKIVSGTGTVTSEGHFRFDTSTATNGDGAIGAESYLKLSNWRNGADSSTDFTFTITVKIDDWTTNAGSSVSNRLAVFVGNGSSAIAFYVDEHGIYYGSGSSPQALYVTSTSTYDSDAGTTVVSFDNTFTTDFFTLTLVWLSESTATELGATSGYYLWLDDMLVGDCLAAVSGISSYASDILVGDTTNGGFVTVAEISDMTFDISTAWAPTSLTVVPEPSTFGLIFAGTALALAVARRRRRRVARAGIVSGSARG